MKQRRIGTEVETKLYSRAELQRHFDIDAGMLNNLRRLNLVQDHGDNPKTPEKYAVEEVRAGLIFMARMLSAHEEIKAGQGHLQSKPGWVNFMTKLFLAVRYLKPNEAGKTMVDEMEKQFIHMIKNSRMWIMPGIGRFKSTFREAHRGRNPRSGETVTIPARKQWRFRLANDIKRELTKEGKK